MATVGDLSGINAVNGIGTLVSRGAFDAGAPTEAQCITGFGPASKNRGKMFIVNSAGLNLVYYLIICDGTKYATTPQLTVAA